MCNRLNFCLLDLIGNRSSGGLLGGDCLLDSHCHEDHGWITDRANEAKNQEPKALN